MARRQLILLAGLLAVPLAGLAVLLATRPSTDRALAASALALLARARDRRPERGARVRHGCRRSPARRPARAPRLARVPRRVGIPGAARARDAGCPARPAESGLRDRHPDRARDCERRLPPRRRSTSTGCAPCCLQNLLLAAMARLARGLADAAPGSRRLGRARADVLAARRPLGRRSRALRLRRRPLSRALARAALRPLLALAVAFILLAESLVAIALGRNWQASWWEWHVLMLAAFALIAVMAHREGPEERFARLYLDKDAQPADGAVRRPPGLHRLLGAARSDRGRREMLNTYFDGGDPRGGGARGRDRPPDRRRRVRHLPGDGHPERAARAALALQAAVAPLAGEHSGLAALPRRRQHGRGERRRARHGQRPHLQRRRRHRQPRLADRRARAGRRRRDQRGDGAQSSGGRRRSRSARSR